MSMHQSPYLTSLSAGDHLSEALNIDTIVQDLEQAASGVLKTATQTAGESASSLIKTGLQNLTGSTPAGSGTVPAGGTSQSVSVQAPEKPVPTTTSSLKAKIITWSPLVAGVGVWFWKKSVLWTLGTVAVTWFVSRKLRKGGN